MAHDSDRKSEYIFQHLPASEPEEGSYRLPQRVFPEKKKSAKPRTINPRSSFTGYPDRTPRCWGRWSKGRSQVLGFLDGKGFCPVFCDGLLCFCGNYDPILFIQRSIVKSYYRKMILGLLWSNTNSLRSRSIFRKHWCTKWSRSEAYPTVGGNPGSCRTGYLNMSESVSWENSWNAQVKNTFHVPKHQNLFNYIYIYIFYIIIWILNSSKWRLSDWLSDWYPICRFHPRRLMNSKKYEIETSETDMVFSSLQGKSLQFVRHFSSYAVMVVYEFQE